MQAQKQVNESANAEEMCILIMEQAQLAFENKGSTHDVKSLVMPCEQGAKQLVWSCTFRISELYSTHNGKLTVYRDEAIARQDELQI